MILEDKIEKPRGDLARYKDARNCIRLVLGRHPLSAHEIFAYKDQALVKQLEAHFRNREFRQEVLMAVSMNGRPAASRFQGQPSRRFTEWVVDTLDLEPSTAATVSSAQDWTTLISAVLGDQRFVSHFPADLIPMRSEETLSVQLARCLDLRAGAMPVLRSISAIDPAATVARLDLNADPDVLRKQSNLEQLSPAFHQITSKRGVMRSLNDDPQILLFDVPVGRRYFSFDLLFQQPDTAVEQSHLKIYFDFGDGFSEQNAVKFPAVGGRILAEGVIVLEEPARQLRIDPCAHEASFQIRHFVLRSF